MNSLGHFNIVVIFLNKMARRKKKRSINIDRAQVRHAAILSIDSALDFGEGLSAQAFGKLLAETRQALADYNTLLSDLDSAYTAFKVLERSLTTMSTRMLSGVAARYGKESVEYTQAGGTRPSERRKSQPSTGTPEAESPAPAAG